MKTKLVSTLVAAVLCLTGSLRAQVIVEDPVSIAQDAVNEVLDLAKYVEMINNQVQQLNSAVSTLRQIEHYVQIIGDPSQIVNLIGLDGLFAEFENSGVGRTLGELQQLASGIESLRSNANGLYQSIGETLQTPSGFELPRAEELYRKFAAIETTAHNFETVFDDIGARRKVLKGQMVETGTQLQASTTDAETQKLSGVIAGQAAQLQSLSGEVELATSQAVVQDISNRNDAEKQRQARVEEQQAEHAEAMKNYGQTFKLSTKPSAFPK